MRLQVRVGMELREERVVLEVTDDEEEQKEIIRSLERHYENINEQFLNIHI